MSSDPTTKESTESEVGANTLDVHYIKVSDYKPWHIDGAFGGLTSSGYIYLGVYCERGPIPRKVTYELQLEDETTARMGEEVDKDSKQGIVREVVAGLYMNKTTAVNLRTWLDERINSMPNDEKGE